VLAPQRDQQLEVLTSRRRKLERGIVAAGDLRDSLGEKNPPAPLQPVNFVLQ
jgi:hypothetical protein